MVFSFSVIRQHNHHETQFLMGAGQLLRAKNQMVLRALRLSITIVGRPDGEREKTKRIFYKSTTKRFFFSFLIGSSINCDGQPTMHEGPSWSSFEGANPLPFLIQVCHLHCECYVLLLLGINLTTNQYYRSNWSGRRISGGRFSVQQNVP